MQAVRTAQFLGIGFTKRGYEARKRQFTPGALSVDLSGRNFIITGANSGIGKEAALAVAQRGGNVHMVCRDRQRGESALSAVKSVAADPSRIELHICDLASLSDIRSFAEHWTGEGPKPVHCLVNNAGLMVHTRSDTIDGVEYNFGVNVLGTYCLTELLLPSLKAADSARVITVSSGGALLSGKEALREGTCTGDDLVKEIPSSSSPPTGTPSSRKIDGELAYSRNKRCQIALTEHWSKLHKSSGIFWAAMHPGWSSTEGFKGAMPEFHNFFSSSLRTAAEGADTICWLAIADEVRNYKSGLFFLDRTVVPKHFWIGGTGYKSEDVSDFVVYLNKLALDKAGIKIAG